jgi:hypothetical protein
MAVSGFGIHFGEGDSARTRGIIFDILWQGRDSTVMSHSGFSLTSLEDKGSTPRANRIPADSVAQSARGNLSDGASAATRSTPPPKQSLDGPPSGVRTIVMGGTIPSPLTLMCDMRYSKL